MMALIDMSLYQEYHLTLNSVSSLSKSALTLWMAIRTYMTYKLTVTYVLFPFHQVPIGNVWAEMMDFIFLIE